MRGGRRRGLQTSFFNGCFNGPRFIHVVYDVNSLEVAIIFSPRCRGEGVFGDAKEMVDEFEENRRKRERERMGKMI